MVLSTHTQVDVITQGHESHALGDTVGYSGDTVITQGHEHQDMGIQGIGFFFLVFFSSAPPPTPKIPSVLSRALVITHLKNIIYYCL